MAKNKTKTKTKAKTPKKDTRNIPYPDPCFHCKNLEITGSGMACKAESPAFWNDLQGFEVDDEGNQNGVCLKFSPLSK